MLLRYLLLVLLMTPAIVMSQEIENANYFQLKSMLLDVTIEAEIENKDNKITLISGKEHHNGEKLLVIRDLSTATVSPDLGTHLMPWPGTYHDPVTNEVIIKLRLIYGNCFSKFPGIYWREESYNNHGQWTVNWNSVELTTEGTENSVIQRGNEESIMKAIKKQTCNEIS
jgi:hypothetical protein